MGLIYRVQQFFHVLTAKPDAAEWERASQVLDGELAALFLRMLPPDQAHALRVYAILQDKGLTDQDLLAAALLHDIGKSVHRPSILDRIIVVLANQFFPRKVLQWGKSEPTGWRRPFSIAFQHPRWGAELAASQGASPRVVELIRRHQEPTASEPRSTVDQMLWELQRVDSEN
jgi:putative nucleotidyltransferase with HDIG domain